MTDSDQALLWQMIGGAGKFHRFSFMRDGRAVAVWLPVHERFARRSFERLCTEDDCLVSTVPRLDNRHGWPGRTCVLWAQLDNGRQAKALEAFRPEPTMVLREGTSVRRVALWALWGDKPLDDDWGIRANKRIAHKLGTKKKHAEFTFTFRPPGTVLRKGREKPLLVSVEHRSEAIYSAREVVGALQEAPAPSTAWRDAA